MDNNNRIELDTEILDKVSGGSVGFNPDANGTYTMRCQFTGAVFYGVSLSQAIEIAKFGATIPNTSEGEQQIIDWAREMHYIN